MMKHVIIAGLLILALVASGCLCCSNTSKGIEGCWVSDDGKTVILVEDRGVVTIKWYDETYHGDIEYIGNATYYIDVDEATHYGHYEDYDAEVYVQMLDDDHVEIISDWWWPRRIELDHIVLERHDEYISNGRIRG